MKKQSITLLGISLFICLLLISITPSYGLDFQLSDEYDYWFTKDEAFMHKVVISADGEYLAVESNSDLYQFHKSSWAPLWVDKLATPRSIAISADGHHIVEGGTFGELFFYQKDHPSRVWNTDLGDEDVKVAISEDGIFIAGVTTVGSSFYRIRYFNYTSDIQMWSCDLPYGAGGENFVALSADAQYVAMGTAAHDVFFFNTSVTSPKVPMWTHDTGAPIVDMKISEDGSLLFVSVELTGILIFNTTSATPNIPIKTFHMTNTIMSLDISSTGEVYVIGNSTGLCFFNLTSPNPQWTIAADVKEIALSADGHFLIAGFKNPDKMVFFRTESPTPLWTYRAYEVVSSVDISSHGETFAVCTQNLYCFYRTLRGSGYLGVDLIDQKYTKDEFDIIFAVKDITGTGIESAGIQMWWNGTEVSNNVDELGLGVYRILLEPLTVIPGDPAILLNMTINASGYNETYYQTYISVDPSALSGSEGPPNEPQIPGYNVIIITAIIALAGALIIWKMKKRN